MIELNQLPDHLKDLKPDDWHALFALIPAIESADKFGEVQGGNRLPDGSIAMPYWHSTELVNRFLDVVGNLQLVPVYDWVSWSEGKRLLADSSTNYNQLAIETLCKLFTIVIRANRFNDGYLVGMFANGTMLRIIQAIKRNREQYFLLRD